MKQLKLIPFSIISLLILLSLNIPFINSGYQNDVVGDTDIPFLDITRLNISKTELTITLSQSPYFNISSEKWWRFYNIWIDTSMEDTNPDTITWSTEVYEYIAHFDCRNSSGQWINNSYIQATRYYLEADGGTKHTGSFWWDGDSWAGADPNIDVAIIVGNTISFNVDGAIFREQPIGTGYVVQGVASTSDGSIKDIGPNSGWCDEFDNMCSPPTSNTNTSFSLPNISLIITFISLGLIASIITFTKKWIRK